MTSLVVRGVCENLYREFSDIPVYTERVVQGLDEPCFFVYLKSSHISLFRGKRYLMKNRVCVEFFAPQLVENSSCGGVIERLCTALEQISCDGIVRGTDLTSEIKEGTLIMSINYNMFVYKAEADNTELMWDMTLNLEE